MHTSLRQQKKQSQQQQNPSARAGFTLIELLTVIAIIGILAAILIPTVSKVRETARRTVDQSNIRQIGQAALIYSSDNDGRLPGTNLSNIGEVATVSADLKAYAAALARSGGLNDATMWISGSDTETSSLGFSTILNGDKTSVVKPFDSVTTLSFVAIAGLATNLPSTTPIAFTRGLNKTNGDWDTKTATKKGVYGNEGGHIVFLGGNVQFFRDVKGSDGTGALIDINGSRTKDVTSAVPSSAAFLALPSTSGP